MQAVRLRFWNDGLWITRNKPLWPDRRLVINLHPDISEGKGNAAKALRLLGWKAEAHMKDVIAMKVKAELETHGRRASDRQKADGG